MPDFDYEDEETPRVPCKPYRKRRVGEPKAEYERKKAACNYLKRYYKYNPKGKAHQKRRNIKVAEKMETLETFAKESGFIYSTELGKMITLEEEAKKLLHQIRAWKKLGVK